MEPDCYAANLQALRVRSPALVALIDAATPYPLESSDARSGARTAKAGGWWLHSRYDPEVEGRKIAAEAIATGAELIVVLGLGLGYSTRSALSAGAKVAVIESSEAWLAALLRSDAMVDIISDERCTLILCPEGRGVADYLDEAAPRSVAVIENGATMAAFPEAAETIRLQVSRYRKKLERKLVQL